MRKLIAFVMVIIVAFLSSCSDTDTKSNSIKAEITMPETEGISLSAYANKNGYFYAYRKNVNERNAYYE